MNDISDLMKMAGIYMGRQISSHKKEPVGCRCVWNANLISPTLGKVWFGDLNLTREGQTLKDIASEVGETLYVLREMGCRFETEDDSVELLITRAVWNTEMDIP